MMADPHPSIATSRPREPSLRRGDEPGRRLQRERRDRPGTFRVNCKDLVNRKEPRQ